MITLDMLYRALDRVTPLAFAIIGKSLDGGEPWAVGSGVFIAPYLALTAKHVIRGTWNEFEPEWKRNLWPKTETRTTHFLVLSQKLYVNREGEATWTVEETISIPYTDLMLLRISPQNEIAKAYQWGGGFLELQLLPPPVGADLWLFGYPECHAENDNERNVITGDFKLEIVNARVTAVEDFRRDSLKDFPGFEFVPAVKGGGSGGPVFWEDRLCGIASIGLQGDDVQTGYAAALWPLVFAPIDFRVGAPERMLDLMKRSALFTKPRDLETVEARAYIDECDICGEPKKYARLRP
jgi:hypothetical protein